ncbi:MAG: hypothetical protein U0169_26615 [Polyangiaceae bacterium]
MTPAPAARLFDKSFGRPFSQATLTVLAVVAGTLLPIAAHAEPTTGAGSRLADDFTDRGNGDGRQVIFTDDPLAAEVGGAAIPRIVVRGGSVRVGLVRLRTQFVSEMLKSVENM